MNRDRIYLIGFMGVGKTTVAKLYSTETGCRWVDTDAYIEKQNGCRVQEIFAKNGETYFRELEASVLKKVSEEQNGNGIISCGGGIVLKPENVRYMKEHGTIIYLRASEATLVLRIQSAEGRPVLQEGKKPLNERVAELLELRNEYYEKAADIIIDTDNQSPKEVVEALLK